MQFHSCADKHENLGLETVPPWLQSIRNSLCSSYNIKWRTSL